MGWVAHKTEAGAVVLNLENEDAVKEAAVAMPAQSFLVEEMVTDGVAELLVGVVADPAHGYVLTLGAGGTLTEVLQDKVSCLVPASPEDVRNALGSVRGKSSTTHPMARSPRIIAVKVAASASSSPQI